jgi:hypothetical protein
VSLTDQAKEIAKNALCGNMENVAGAVEQALAQIKGLPNYPAMAEGLVREAVKQLVYLARHQHNNTIKNHTGANLQRAARRVAAYSPAVTNAHKSVYDLCIDGTTLGSIKGSRLQVLLQRTVSTIAGHRLQEELLTWLTARVPSNKTVRESVKEDELAKFYYETRDRLSE